MYSTRLLQLFADYEITGYCEASLKMACLFMWASSDWYSAEDGVMSAAEKTKTSNERKTNFNRVYLGKRLLPNMETKISSEVDTGLWNSHRLFSSVCILAALKSHSSCFYWIDHHLRKSKWYLIYTGLQQLSFYTASVRRTGDRQHLVRGVFRRKETTSCEKKICCWEQLHCFIIQQGSEHKAETKFHYVGLHLGYSPRRGLNATWPQPQMMAASYF